jgi:hypothetical protein
MRPPAAQAHILDTNRRQPVARAWDEETADGKICHDLRSGGAQNLP